MTDKELHKLGRKDLLQLMLESAKEVEKLKNRLKETEEQLAGMENSYERLRKRLDEKDSQIHNLKENLESQKKRRDIELEEAGSIAEAALRLNGVFEAAQKAAEQYVYNVRRLHDMQSEEAPAIQTMKDIRIRALGAGHDSQRDMHEQEQGKEQQQGDGNPDAGSD